MSDSENPAVEAADRTSGFRFPAGTQCSDDFISTEYRLAITGWCDIAKNLSQSNADLQSLRDVVFRLNDLVVALSARHLWLTAKVASAEGPAE